MPRPGSAVGDELVAGRQLVLRGTAVQLLVVADDDLVQTILKGKKAEKPPNMPGYEAKSINADQARELSDYMKSLRQ